MFLPPEEVRDITQLPIFVSEKVILPFVAEAQPIRVTEKKYIEMLDDISLGDRFLGVSSKWFINRDHERSPVGLPFINSTGCIAELLEYKRFTDDDALIKLKGLARYRIVEYIETEKSYPVTKIKFFEEENERYHDQIRMQEEIRREPELEEATRRACLAGQRVLTKIYRSLGNDEYEAPLMQPSDPVPFSFLVAALFSFDEDDRLHILQSPCPIHRLEFAAEWLEEYEKAVEDNIDRKEMLKPFQHIKNNPDSG